ncbi:RNA-binding protein lupus La, partial [Pavlovales sp. CCMP2436]
EYYFSEQNLANDFYLRKHMDADGWVELALVSKFNRVRLICDEVQTIASALADSVDVEL